MARVIVDATKFVKGVEKLNQRVNSAKNRGLAAIGGEILRLGTFEVPHDKGKLQDSGKYEPNGDGKGEVGYNKVYAARLHEHPEYRFQKGRKGKYLIDPIMNNLRVLQKLYGETMKEAFK